MTLLNCGSVCPALSHILINTYRNNSQLFVDGQCILSKEGTTQGDPLAMAMYAIRTQRESATWVEQLVLPHLYASMLKEKWNVG